MNNQRLANDSSHCTEQSRGFAISNYSITICVGFLFLSRFPETDSNITNFITCTPQAVSVNGIRFAVRHDY